VVLSWLCFRYKATTSIVPSFSNKAYPIYQNPVSLRSCPGFQNWHRYHRFLPSKEYVQPLMRCSSGSTVDIKLPSSFLSYSLTAVSSITKTPIQYDYACTAQNHQPVHNVFSALPKNANDVRACARLRWS